MGYTVTVGCENTDQIRSEKETARQGAIEQPQWTFYSSIATMYLLISAKAITFRETFW
jgi:hypothetical protein